MEIIGSLFLVLALAVFVVLFVGQPFFQKTSKARVQAQADDLEREHQVSSLLAERDRVLNALQELDFDYALGKVPPEDYPQQRAVLLKSGAEVLRQLDQFEQQEGVAAGVPAGSAGLQAQESGAEERIEATVAARRADAAARQTSGSGAIESDGEPLQPAATGTYGNGKGKDELEEMIAMRKRQRKESAAGFCPRCGKPAQKSDRFCSKCGTTL
jgi:hypothetical protein